MGKLFKYALGLFLIGVGLVTIFSIMSENDLFAMVSEDEFVYHELTYTDTEISVFDFDFENRDIVVRPSEDGNIKVMFYSNDKDVMTVTDDSETLSIVNDIEWYNRIFIGWDFLFNREYYQVIVYLPSTENYTFKAESSNGKLDVMNIQNFNILDMSTSNGVIHMSDVEAYKMTFDSSNGEARLTDVICATDIKLSTSNGRVYLTNVTGTKIDAHSSNGRIIATGLVAENIILDTSNGDIEATVDGAKDDYEVTMSTSNGDLDYDGLGVTGGHYNTGGQYQITLDTSNGDITLTFTE